MHYGIPRKKRELDKKAEGILEEIMADVFPNRRRDEFIKARSSTNSK